MKTINVALIHNYGFHESTNFFWKEVQTIIRSLSESLVIKDGWDDVREDSVIQKSDLSDPHSQNNLDDMLTTFDYENIDHSEIVVICFDHLEIRQLLTMQKMLEYATKNDKKVVVVSTALCPIPELQGIAIAKNFEEIANAVKALL